MIVTLRFRCPICQDESTVSGQSTPLLEKAIERGVCEVVCGTCDKKSKTLAGDWHKEADEIANTLAVIDLAALDEMSELILRARRYRTRRE